MGRGGTQLSPRFEWFCAGLPTRMNALRLSRVCWNPSFTSVLFCKEAHEPKVAK